MIIRLMVIISTLLLRKTRSWNCSFISWISKKKQPLLFLKGPIILLMMPKIKFYFLKPRKRPLFTWTTIAFIFSPRVTLVAKNYAVGWWNKNKVLYATPFEIREWNNNQENLISRFGEVVIGLGQLSKITKFFLRQKTV